MYSYDTRIAASQTGPDGTVTLSAIVTLLQDCSLWWMESEPGLAECLERTGTGMMIGSRQVEVVRRPAYREHVRVETSIYRANRMLGYRNTFICTPDGEPLVKSWGVGVFVSLETGEMVKLPEQIAGDMVIDPKRDMGYLPRKIRVPQAEPVEHAPYTVMRFDTDTNRHMNNVSYIRVAEECIDDPSAVTGLRVEYKSQVRLGDDLRLLAYGDGSATTVSLAAEDGTPCALVEFTR